MASRDAVHRTIIVVDIAESTHPIRTNDDRLVIREAMYDALATAFGRHDWPRCRWEDRGDGVLILVPPEVPKARLVTGLPERLEAALARHNAAMEERDGDRAAATRMRLRVAVHAGEVTFDRHGVVGAAIDHTFRLVDAPPLKAALAGSLDSCVLIVSDWFYSDVVYHRQDARPGTYRHVGCEVKDTELSAWLRAPEPRLTLERTALPATRYCNSPANDIPARWCLRSGNSRYEGAFVPVATPASRPRLPPGAPIQPHQSPGLLTGLVVVPPSADPRGRVQCTCIRS